MMMTRRSMFAGALITAAAPTAFAHAATTSSWLSYENRLRARLGDAGGGRFDEGFARALLRSTNGFRSGQRMASFAWDDGLAACARAQAADMAARNYFSHNTPEGFTPFDRASLLVRDKAGPVAENLAWREEPQRATTPREFEDMWEHSPGHRQNLLHAECTHAGYGVVKVGSRTYGVGVYGSPAVRLAKPLPLRVSGGEEVSRALAGSSMDRMGFTRPGQELARVPAKSAQAPTLQPGVWQLRPVKSAGGNMFDIYAGPVFIVA